MRAGLVTAAFLIGAALLAPAIARADAQIAVRLTDHEGRPVDGTVTLTARNVTRSCRTTASRCTITAPAGTYTVTMQPVRGTAPPSRTLTVPASGTIALALTARPAATVTTTPVQTSTQPGTVQTQPGPTSGTATTISTAPATLRPGVLTAATSGGSATASGTGGTSGSTSGGSTTATTTPTPTATTSGATQQAGTIAARDLTRGTTLAVQGTVLDGAGRPTDATITVRRAGALVGTARTTAGRFSMYDLPAATYDVALESSRGTRATARLTVGATSSRVTLRVP